MDFIHIVNEKTHSRHMVPALTARLRERTEVLYWRTATGEEVDFVIETGGRVLPIEVKATSRPRIRDAARLRTFRSEYGKKARAGLLLHTGTTIEWLTPDVLAAPWWRVC